MIIYDFSLPVKQVRVDTFYYCLMLILVISQIETAVVFVFNLRIHIVPGVDRITCKKNWGFEGLKKSKTFSGPAP